MFVNIYFISFYFFILYYLLINNCFNIYRFAFCTNIIITHCFPKYWNRDVYFMLLFGLNSLEPRYFIKKCYYILKFRKRLSQFIISCRSIFSYYYFKYSILNQSLLLRATQVIIYLHSRISLVCGFALRSRPPSDIIGAFAWNQLCGPPRCAHKHTSAMEPKVCAVIWSMLHTQFNH